MSGYTRRDLVAVAESLGFTFEGVGGSGHLKFRHANGNTVTLPSTPSEYRGFRNARLMLEREAGRKLPRVTKRRSHKAFKPSGFSIAAARADTSRHHELTAETVADLEARHADLVQRCRDYAERRHTLRQIPPLLSRIAAVEQRLIDLGQPVERFDPYSLPTPGA